MKKLIKYVYKNFLLFIVIAMFISQTIVYSALSTTMNITGLGYSRVESDVRITDFAIETATSSAISQYEEFNKSQVQSEITLPNSDSTITYKIEITNYGSAELGIYSITGLQDNLSYELSDYQLKEKLCDSTAKCSLGSKTEILLTIKYNETSDQTAYQLNLSFEFKPVYSVSYSNITNNDFPEYIMEGESLNINIIESYYPSVIMDGTQLDITEYTYSNNNLIVTNVTGPIEVSVSSAVGIYQYTGTIQTFTAPTTGTYQIELWGASSGSKDEFLGGLGGYTKGNIELTEGTTLYVVVGGQGNNISGGLAGYNGGNGPSPCCGGTSGGATDIRLTEDTVSRIMVAGAGGAAAWRGEEYGDGDGGAGGGLTAESGVSINNSNSYGYGIGTGGTQTSGGLLYWTDTGAGNRETGYYSETTSNNILYQVGGLFHTGGLAAASGGGGYFGGGASFHGGAGGGSSYISGHNGCIAITEDSTSDNIIQRNDSEGNVCVDGTTDITCSYHYSNYIFTDTVMIDGDGYNWTTEKEETAIGMPTYDGTATMLGNEGNGYAKISLVSTGTNVLDASGNNNVATSTNLTYTEDGASFDGSSSYIEYPTDLDISFPITYAFKVKYNALEDIASGTNGVVFGDYKTKAGFGYRYSNGGYILNISGGPAAYVVSSTGMEFGQFYTYHIVYNSISDQVLYRDGVALTKTSETNYWTWTSTKSIIGKRIQGTDTSNSYLNGTIEYFMIYDKALTTEEIAQNVNATDKSNLVTDELKLFYYFK